jgi:VCBS repeat protein
MTAMKSRNESCPGRVLLAAIVSMAAAALIPGGATRATAEPLFEPLPAYEMAPAMEPQASVSACDLNRDGNVDLVIPNYEAPGSVSVLLGRGDGTFGPNRQYGTVIGATSVAVGDLNADGLEDVVVAGEEMPSILFGRGDGTLGEQAELALSIDRYGDKQVAIGDLNADGRNDLVVVDVAYNKLTVLLGAGDGTFPRQADYSVGGSPACVAIADLDGDAKLDLVTANRTFPFGSETCSVLLGRGDGSFQARRDFSLGGVVTYPAAISVADLNHDGAPDLVVAGWFSVGGVFLGDGSGGFEMHGQLEEYWTTSGTYITPRQAIAIADLDGDGNQDLAASNFWGHIALRPGTGDGTFPQRIAFESPFPTTFVTIADVNGDGRPDLVGPGAALLNVGPQSPPRVRLQLSPEALNLRSERPWISAILTVSEPYLASDVAVPSLRVNGLIVPLVGDAGHIGASGHDLTVKLEWRRLKAALEPGDRAIVTLAGTVAGRPFTATDEIRVIGDRRAATLAQAEPSGVPSLAVRPAFRAGAASTIRFSLATESTATLELFNVQGRLLERRDVTSGPGWHSAELKELPAGVYLIRLRQAERSATSRVVVVH